ncbi:MAG: S-layer protein, partial [Candidatus Micrarchaeaceae archaeon]
MKSLNAKRIAAVAASLVMGLAVAGQGVTFGNVPIINSQGQPVVQIVVGHAAAPSDGVVAANIAAVIGNLAFTTQNVTATVTNAGTVLSCGGTPTCSVTNQQVWLGEKGLSAPSGSYGFTALIGSVLNRAVLLNTPSDTKSLQPYTSQYAYPETTSIVSTPTASPYTGVGAVPTSTSVVANYNGGGVSFSSFSSTSGGDNILQITSSQLPSLANNWGANGESTSLWITGFPVFNQQSGVNNFQLLDAGGAYQATFSKPIANTISNGTASNDMNINVPIRLLGENWTIVNETSPGSSVSSTTTTTGGSLELASALSPLRTVYVGQNVTNTTIDGFNVQLTDLGQPNSAGQSNAAINVYYDGVLTNTTQVAPFSTQKFNVTGHVLYVHVGSTFAGLYA